MVYKQDFTNVLDIQIKRFEDEIFFIEEEIKIRSESFFGANQKLEWVQNQRNILSLNKELESKKDYLFKLKDKKLFDTAELNEDYVECINNFQSLIDKGSSSEDPHDVARFEYIKTEMLLWNEKSDELPEKKEACVFYYKALKELTN